MKATPKTQIITENTEDTLKHVTEVEVTNNGSVDAVFCDRKVPAGKTRKFANNVIIDKLDVTVVFADVSGSKNLELSFIKIISDKPGQIAC